MTDSGCVATITDPQQAELVERVRAALARERSMREVSMFGGRSVMVREKMVVSALKGGDLLVRVPVERHDQLLDRPGSSQAEMGEARSMGPGWIQVAAASLDDDGLRFWITVALDHNRSVTGG
jgi:hypothetical protein